MPLDLTALSQVLNRPWIVAAWLFGSSQCGSVRLGSDVDIALLADPTPSLEEQLDLQVELATLTREDVDLVLLNGASSVLRFEALQGRSLMCNDPEARAVFASLAAREYEDDMALAQRGMNARQERRS